MQHVSRIDVEGGFLDGLSVEFSAGLNVIIGARGTGKTSLIELLRFSLGARNHTPESAKRSQQQAIAILQEGSVSVAIEDEEMIHLVSRSSADPDYAKDTDIREPLVFSQLEIESLGLTELGRLRLIDSFVPRISDFLSREDELIAMLRSAYKESEALNKEVAALASELERLPSLEIELNELSLSAAAHNDRSAGVAQKQDVLSETSRIIAEAGVKESMLTRFGEYAGQWETQLTELISSKYDLEAWVGRYDEDPLKQFRGRYSVQLERLTMAQKAFQLMGQEAQAAREPIRRVKVEAEIRARGIRSEVEKIAEGTGAVSRQLAHVRNSIAQLQSLKSIHDSRRERLDRLRLQRSSMMARLADVRLARYEARSNAAAALTAAVGPQVDVRIVPLGALNDYVKALVGLLRGSGLKYNDLATVLSERVSPQELVSFVEDANVDGLVSTTDIPRDRAWRLIQTLKDADISSIATARLDDQVELSLLDGLEYKAIQRLSAGQRCTVVLSIVLQNTSRVLIIDQPEDHLDNAYIASTIVKALRRRKTLAQVIVATHNANIPVLGEADRVIELVSDGRNGYLQTCCALDEPEAVSSITRVMEGGHEAFEQRALFYHEHAV